MNKQAHEELSADLIDLASNIDAVYALPTLALHYLCDPDDQQIVRLVTELLVRILHPIARGLDPVMLHPDETPHGMILSAENVDLMSRLVAFGRSEDPHEVDRIRDTVVEGLGGNKGEYVGDLFDRLIQIRGLVADSGYTLALQVPMAEEHSS